MPFGSGSNDWSNALAILFPDGAQWSASGDISDESSYDNNVNWLDHSVPKPSWSELEAAWNDYAAGSSGSFTSESLSFDQSDWDQTKEIRIRYQDPNAIPSRIELQVDATSEDISDITPFTTSAAPLTLGTTPALTQLIKVSRQTVQLFVLNDDGSVDAVFDLRLKAPIDGKLTFTPQFRAALSDMPFGSGSNDWSNAVAILFPDGAQWSASGDISDESSYDNNVNWLDHSAPKPSWSELEAAWNDYAAGSSGSFTSESLSFDQSDWDQTKKFASDTKIRNAIPSRIELQVDATSEDISDITPFTTSAAPLTLGDYPRAYSIDQGVETNGPTLVLNDDGSVDAVFDLRLKAPIDGTLTFTPQFRAALSDMPFGSGSDDWSNAVAILFPDGAQWSASGDISDESSYDNNVNWLDHSAPKPSWSELESAWNDYAAGSSGSFTSESLSFDQSDWDQTKEIRIRYQDPNAIPSRIELQVDVNSFESRITIDLASVEEDLGYKGDEEDIIEQGTAALGLNPFVITAAQLLANFTDADDAIADLSVVNLIADSGTLTETPDGWEFIPSEDFVGNVNFSFSVTDGEAFLQLQPSLLFTTVNDDLYDDWGWVDTDITGGPEDEAIAISSEQLLDSIDYDENWDEEELSISGITVTTPDAGEIVEDGEGGFTFNPADDFNGSVSFSYTVTDPEGSSVDVVRTIRVVAVNDAPELAEGTANPFIWHG